MAEETNSVRITNAQVYEKLMEINAIQIEMVAELRNMKHLPEKVNAIENELARLKVIAGLAYGMFAAILAGVVTALLRVL
jgi:hypothetical protein